jgi:hypothetical protein
MTFQHHRQRGEGGFLPLGPIVSFVAGARRQSTYAAWPVWSGSTKAEPKFMPLPKKKAVKLWHKARRFERQTRIAGHQDGAVTRNGLAILQALLFDFLDYATGELMPSQASIARAANISLRSVGRGLAALKAAGIINALRRCCDHWHNGRFALKQLPNAYAVLPETQWRGFDERPAPAPYPDAWGASPPLPSAIEAACMAKAEGIEAELRELESDERDRLAATLARLGRHVQVEARSTLYG